MSRVHRHGVARTAEEARKRRKRPMVSAPAVPGSVTLDFKKREANHHRVFNAHVKWTAVTKDVANRPLTPEHYEVQLQACDASGEPIETHLQEEAANAYGKDFSVTSGSAPVTNRYRSLTGSAVVSYTLTGLTAGLRARVDFWLRKETTGGTVKIEVYDTTSSSSVQSKNVTPSKTDKPDVSGSVAFTPVSGHSYAARVTWISGSGTIRVDQIQWHTDGDTATWKKTIHNPDVDASFPHVVKPDSWYYRARVRALNRVHHGYCWSAWSDWTSAIQPAGGEPTGPPSPDGLALHFDKVEGSQKFPWRARVGFNEVGAFVTPDGEAQDNPRHYDVQLGASNDGGTHTINVRRHHLHADASATKTHADFFHIHGKRHFRARVRSVDKHGIQGAWSAWTSWASPHGAPAVVTGVTWTNPSPARLRADWSPPSDLTDVFLYKVKVIRNTDGAVVDTGFTAASRWSYDIPKADRHKSHKVRVTVIEDALTLDADEDDGAGGSSAYTDGDSSSDTDSSSVTPTQTWDETDVSTTSGQISDGHAPSSSPTPTVKGGVGFLSVTWTGVTNVDPVTYKVYCSTTDLGSTPAAWQATTPVGSLIGTLFFIKTLAGGTALTYGTTYYVAVIATDPDGASTASLTRGNATMVQANTPDIATNAITANEILAGTITADKFNAVLTISSRFQTATSGNRVVIDATAAADRIRFYFNTETTPGYVKASTDTGIGILLMAAPGVVGGVTGTMSLSEGGLVKIGDGTGNATINLGGHYAIGRSSSGLLGVGQGDDDIWIIGDTNVKFSASSSVEIENDSGGNPSNNLQMTTLSNLSSSGGSALPAKWSTSGNLLIDRSTRAVKTAIVDYAPKGDVLDLAVRRAKYLVDIESFGEHAPHVPCLIAEEVHALGLDDLVWYERDADGAPTEPKSVHYDRVGLLLIPIVRNLRDRLKTLEDK